MSQRVKKPGRAEEAQGKRRRRRPSGSDGDEDGTRSGSNSGGNGSLSGMWTPRHLSDLKVSSIYNRNSAEAPAEVTSLYRKDLISAMKLADSEPLTPEEYWLITDPWKQEWEKGVQVPVNPESLPEPQVVYISPVAERSHDFRLPKKKNVRVTHDDFFNPDYHQLVSTAARAEKVCSYDLDDVDAAWLGCANADRGMQSLPVISEFLMEQVVEELELQCWEQVQTILKSQEGLGIEYDENVICDVCRSPESEEGNEMVFCDSCNICVHQACYGITSIPSGSFLCRTCTLGLRPTCVLCPNIGGAMKATRSGHKWAHVACAIWIPEVSIGSVEKMEPITKISAIPQSRWSLMCVLCKEKVGACIQCSVKTCKTAYHVTCAFKNGLEMKPIIVDENAEDGIKLRSYCQKHSMNTKKDKTLHSGSEEDGEKKKTRAMTAEERNQARAEKLQQIESEFFKYVRLKDVSQNLAVDMDIVNLVYNYWKLKRKSLNNRPLVPPRPETTQLLTQQQEQDLEQMKLFVQLRQDLERVRNLCYMVSRREKLSRTYFRLREQTFQKQVALLSDNTVDLTKMSGPERAAILEANHGPSIYDQVYSHSGVTNSYKDYESLVTLIAGDDKRELLNGVIKPKKGRGRGSENPYKKTFVNGAKRRPGAGGESSSMSESEVSVKGAPAKPVASTSASTRKPLAYLFDTDSSMDAVIMTNSGRSKAPAPAKKGAKGRGLKQMEKTLARCTTSESEDLDIPVPVPVRGKGRGKTAAAAATKRQPIYSDTESEGSAGKRQTAAIASVATKGALKEFSGKKTKGKQTTPKPIIVPTVSPILTVAKKRGRGPGRKKKNEFEPTELIVPQREAAKKATESIRSVKPLKGKDSALAADGGESPVPFHPVVPKKDKDTVSTKEVPKPKVKEQETLSDSEETKPPVKKKSPVRTAKKVQQLKRKLSSKEQPTTIKPEAKAESELDEFGEPNPASVSYVPQRQAAKKAAEHIRSGLSNIVAARLIIEDEIEASHKKYKSDRSGKTGKSDSSKSPTCGRPKSSSPARDLDENTSVKGASGKGPRQKSPAKAGEGVRGILAKKESAKSPQMTKEGLPKVNDTDLPFLDKGSQSACRRSRERSSSSSSTSSSSSSSGSSSSSRTSSSSRSSSPGSASPEPGLSRKPLGPSSQSTPIGTVTTGPGRKLKTSERSPNNRIRAETSPRAKPIPKGAGPGKSPRRGSAQGPVAPTQLSPTRRGRKSVSPNKRHRNASSSDSEAPVSPTKPTISPPRFTLAKAKFEEKSPRGNRESNVCEIQKAIPAKSHQQARTPPKALARGELDLSSDSEPEPEVKAESPSKVRGRNSRSPAVSADIKNKPMPKTKKKELGLLSEESSAEEKENSTAPSDSPRKTPKQNVPLSTSALSPLTLTTENTEKELSGISGTTDTEPESKRPRFDSSASSHATSSVQSHAPGVAFPLSTPGSSMPRSIFSPTGHGRESDLAEFDSDLYDLARSVTEEYSQKTEQGGHSSLSFSFSQDLLCREDNKEDSARATESLVEKLRLQHLRKSGVSHRPSVDGNSSEYGEHLQDEPQTPGMLDSAPKFEPDSLSVRDTSDHTSTVLAESSDRLGNSTDAAEKGIFDHSSRSPSVASSGSPARSKSIEGDERWVPPSRHGRYGDPEEDERSDGYQSPDSRDMHEMPPIMGDTNVLRIDADQLYIPPEIASTYEQEKVQREIQEALNKSGLLPRKPSPPRISSHSSRSHYRNSAEASSDYPHSRRDSHSYVYPLNPTLANVVTSLASENLPFFHSQSQTPLPKSPKRTAPILLDNSAGYPTSFAHHFGSKQQQLQRPHLHDDVSSMSNVTMRDSSQSSGRANENPLNSLSSSGMPPLSKPPMTSPSILLAAKATMTPQPPPQSTVAQIIESVIQASNNHPASLSSVGQNQAKPNSVNTPGAPSLGMNVHMGTGQMPNFNPSQTQGSGTVPMIPQKVTVPQQPKLLDSGVSDFSAILSNKTNENIPPAKMAPVREPIAPPPVPNNVSVSPRGGGRGRRATTPRVKIEKIVSEEVSPKTRGRGERKASGASPARSSHKAPATPRRGGGRGKLKGKNVVVRKDLAGTVYDIDFDEFEENSEEKFDLRMLRERRKSSDVHTESRKSESSNASPVTVEKQSPRYRGVSFDVDHGHGHRQEKTIPMLQAPLPGPVDMRTYSSSILPPHANEGLLASVAFPHSKDPTSSEIASLFMSNASSSPVIVNELEELDKTLEALTANTKATVPSGMPHLNNVTPSNQKHAHQHLNHIIIGPGDSSLSSSKDSFTTSMSDDKDSRNQLKVKIKGPFLDANYSSHSLPPPTFQQTQHHHHPAEPSHHQMMNVTPIMSNTSSLRRMRKKELLRQYWTQDMNMEGSFNPSSYGSEIGGVGPSNTHHPFSRSVISIPKAVASMAVIPSTKDDYGFDPNDLGPLPPPPPTLPVPEKKKRSRGVNREIAALGILQDGPKGDRRRDRVVAMIPPPAPSEASGRKKSRAINKPNRSAFIPPTLAEFEDAVRPGPSLSANSSTGVVTAVNHPTPKLKIKFADIPTSARNNSGMSSSSASNHVAELDLEGSNKKAKGRPPKKRGISEISAPAPPTMEELKRQSLMFREMVMKDFNDADKRSSKSSGGKKKKKAKKSKREPGDARSETDSTRSKSPEVKVITDTISGPKLILRFGKNRTTSVASNEGSSSSTNNNLDIVKKENGSLMETDASAALLPVQPVDNFPLSSADRFAMGDNDSGFTGSEGSVGSGQHIEPPVKPKTGNNRGKQSKTKSDPALDRLRIDIKPEPLDNQPGSGPSGTVTNQPNHQATGTGLGTSSGIVVNLGSTSGTNPPNLTANKEKLMPIRLKLSRCYEGYSLNSNNKKDTDREPPKPAADSCEVR